MLESRNSRFLAGKDKGCSKSCKEKIAALSERVCSFLLSSCSSAALGSLSSDESGTSPVPLCEVDGKKERQSEAGARVEKKKTKLFFCCDLLSSLSLSLRLSLRLPSPFHFVSFVSSWRRSAVSLSFIPLAPLQRYAAGKRSRGERCLCCSALSAEGMSRGRAQRRPGERMVSFLFFFFLLVVARSQGAAAIDSRKKRVSALLARSYAPSLLRYSSPCRTFRHFALYRQ